MNYFKMNILLIILCLNFGLADFISEQKALNISENFFYYKNDRSSSKFEYNNVQTLNHNDRDIFYVINLNPNGFILISTNDHLMPILGYSFENNFRFGEFPSNIDYLFDLYTKELNEEISRNEQKDYIRTEWEKFSNKIEYTESRSFVNPLITARFDQGSGWNELCPSDSDGPGGQALVGCVAVSMAQVMHYWSYPSVGYGNHGYNHWDYGYQYADFGNAYYDYDQMPNSYPTSETQELLYHCGVAVNMGYGSDGSGANVFGNGNTTERAMKDYFLFKNDLDGISPGNNSSAYRTTLQNELNGNRPIIYVGYSSDGGHAWNIDGYDDDYFHNNWGWGGSQNGYYLLSALNGFDYDQGALINIEPQSLNNPNVVLQNYNYEESYGDGDLVTNPGESINIYITVENLIPWNDAASAELLLSTEDESLTILNEQITIFNLDVGDTYINNNNPFTVQLSNDIALSNHQLDLTILSFGNNGEVNQNNYNLTIQVSLDQAGFPYVLTALDENGNPYTAVTTVKSSPLIIDINNDLKDEIFFGDDNGFVHGIDRFGNPLNGFPIELEGNSKEIWGSPAGADIDNDGEIEIIITSKNKRCYIFDEYGNIELEYETDQYLMGTPSLANLDNDNDLEIVFAGYTNSGDVFAINHNGTNVENFPVNIDEKILRGVAIFDINQNGKDDIVIATENEKLIQVIYDNGNVDTIFESTNKFKSAPSIINNNGEVIILAGDTGGNFYGIKLDGTISFQVAAGNDINSEPGFIEINNQLAIFFGSEDGYLYAIDINGNNLDSWPKYIGQEDVNSSPVFADLNGDDVAEVISATENGKLIIYSIDGTTFENYPLDFNVGFQSSPSVLNLDNDNDLEIIIGSDQNLSVIDIKSNTTNNQFYWYTYRGDQFKTGSYTTSSVLLGDLNYDTQINVQDVVIIINIILGNNSQINAADLNSDGTVDVLDVVSLINLIL